ncbi:MAG TPA: amidohydrolase family protein [Candidatus Acidoferrum sp.]|nr:amidohydrolase family protein [Candidatus Acidoferrum sp.]
MRNGHRITLLISTLAALTHLTVVLASAQAALTPPLSPEVREYVKFADAVIVLAHVRVIDGTERDPRPDQTLIIRDGTIEAIGDATSTPIPPGAKVLDLTDYSVFPGFVGMHDHMFYPQPVNLAGQRARGVLQFEQQSSFSFPRLYLAAGVTSIRTTASVEPYADLNLKSWIDSGKIPGPKIHVTGPYLEGEGNFRLPVHELRGPEDARRTVEFWADQGVTSFKAFTHITRAELLAVVDAAHKRGLTVTGHLCSITYAEAAELGIDDIEHGFALATEFNSDKKPDICPPSTEQSRSAFMALTSETAQVRDLFKTLIQHHVAVTSTLPVIEAYSSDRPPLQQRVLDVLSPQAQAGYLSQRLLQPNSRSLKKEMELERAFVKAGGTLLAGPDPTGIGGVVAGFGDQREVELLVEAGFTPVEAIHIATQNGARFLQEEQRIGTLAPGKRADLVVVRGDPSSKISDIEAVAIVFKDGIAYDPMKLIESVRGLVGLR